MEPLTKMLFSFPRSAWERGLRRSAARTHEHLGIDAVGFGPRSGLACVPTQSVGTRTLFAFFLLTFISFSSGCVNTTAFLQPSAEKPTGIPCEVVLACNPEVIFKPDPANRGAPMPGLGGRMYLFGEGSDCPLVGDGCLVVDLYDDSHPVGSNSVPLEEWRIDRDTLKRLLRRDAVGWGYTLFLPWGTYKPEIKQVQLRLRYEPVNGTPLYAEPCSVVFHQANTASQPVVSQIIEPGGQQIGANNRGPDAPRNGSLPKH
jgi:hypothetical protein